MKMIVILNNIRSSENVGSIFRTADAAGVQKMILCGYTPAPLDRFGRKNQKLAKTALGAEEFVAWEKKENLKAAVAALKNSFSELLVVAVEQSENSVDYRKLKESNLVTPNSNIVLVFGNEVEGLSDEELKLCDLAAEIPMRGRKESLNVSVCAGIVLFELIRDEILEEDETLI